MKREEQELMWAIQGLAQTAEIQSSLYPDFVCKGDELAIRYGEALDSFMRLRKSSLSPEQADAVQKLDSRLD